MRARNYARSVKVEVLLCTADEDPVLGIELDSQHHFSEEVAERDELKNLLFKLAGLPLCGFARPIREPFVLRISTILLVAESQTLDTPRRLRPCRTHDFLVAGGSSHSMG